ncbi:hypothetical protein, partial [Streptococcus pneumoniae]|uniref:hypothetical protein n=1 Tax=Streptococcus pneumoniae TaxID=1313 RepID=UPI0021E02310
ILGSSRRETTVCLLTPTPSVRTYDKVLVFQFFMENRGYRTSHIIDFQKAMSVVIVFTNLMNVVGKNTRTHLVVSELCSNF